VSEKLSAFLDSKRKTQEQQAQEIEMQKREMISSVESISNIGGYKNTIDGAYTNTHIIGGGISANASNTTFVNYLSKQGGTFSIDHPNPSLSNLCNLHHSFVESPTAGDNLYRYSVVVSGGTVTLQLPDYFQFLNKNVQIWVTPTDSFAIGYGKINESYTEVTIFGDQDVEFNVLIIGTRKDKNTKFWRGVETPKKTI
jgi:hypothetical protein